MKAVAFILRALVVIVSTALILEIGFRTEDRLRNGIPFLSSNATGMDSLFNTDEVGKYGRPNATYRQWHLNELGFRGPSLRPNTIRIVTIGSSETFGMFDSPNNEWPRQLEKILNTNTPTQPYEVVNIAYPGMSLSTNLRRLPQMLETTHPRIAVIYPAYANYSRAEHAEPWPIQAPLHPKLLPDHLRWRTGDRFISIYGSCAEALYQRFVPAALRNVLTPTPTPQPPPSGLPRLPETTVDFFRTDLDHMVTLLQSQNIRPILVTHANIFGNTKPTTPEDKALLTDWRGYYTSLSEDGLLDTEARMSTVVREVGHARGVPVVDAAQLIAPTHQNFHDFVHFNDAGSNALAHLVATEVKRQASPN